uniref:Uncharacterized protein n=1 Tax=Rhizophora mucronata TaxID=61149 RepID=A0A2P2N307_RHIMU
MNKLCPLIYPASSLAR